MLDSLKGMMSVPCLHARFRCDLVSASRAYNSICPVITCRDHADNFGGRDMHQRRLVSIDHYCYMPWKDHRHTSISIMFSETSEHQ